MAIQYGDGTTSNAGRIIKVEQVTRTDTTSTGSSTYADVFSSNVSITPQSNSSKFLLIGDLKIGYSSYQAAIMWKFVRTVSGVGSYDLFIGDTNNNRSRCTWGTEEPSDSNNAIYELHTTNGIYLDSPNTTTACTFKVMWKAEQHTAYLNRTHGDGNHAAYPRAASSLTVLEIAG
tara:strand:- start:237 stop:761 length:525 start_codon:yes stop_codon:yes gene_type:complete